MVFIIQVVFYISQFESNYKLSNLMLFLLFSSCHSTKNWEETNWKKFPSIVSVLIPLCEYSCMGIIIKESTILTLDDCMENIKNNGTQEVISLTYDGTNNKRGKRKFVPYIHIINKVRAIDSGFGESPHGILSINCSGISNDDI